MRKNVMALGLLIMFLAFILQASSQTTVEVTPPQGTWKNINSNEANPPEETLSVEANMTSGDKFRVFFSLQQSSEPFLPDGLGITINVTDPMNDISSFVRHVEFDDTGKIVITDPTTPYPTITANYTGTYRANAQSMGVVLIRLLIMQKYELIEAVTERPLAILSPASIVVFVFGVILLLWGASSTKEKKPHKTKSPKHGR